MINTENHFRQDNLSENGSSDVLHSFKVLSNYWKMLFERLSETTSIKLKKKLKAQVNWQIYICNGIGI